MRKTVRAAVLMMGVAGAFGTGAKAQGIPVIDAGSIAQAIAQLQQLQQQMQQLQQTHASFNKLTTMGDIAAILNRPDVRNVLPKDFAGLEALMQGQGGTAQQFKDRDEVFVSSSPSNAAYAAAVEKQRNMNAGQKSVAAQLHEAAAKKIEGVEVLRKQIGQSEDPKTVLDLQARLLAEMASMQALQQQMMAVQIAAAADRSTQELRDREDFEKDLEAQIAAIKRR